MTDIEKFGKKIRKLRLDNKMSQEELAYESGLHRTYIGSVERAEKNLTIKNVFKIAKALGIDPSDLFKFEK